MKSHSFHICFPTLYNIYKACLYKLHMSYITYYLHYFVKLNKNNYCNNLFI